MKALGIALKNKMKSGPPMADDPASMKEQPDKAPVIAPPQGGHEELLKQILEAIMGHGGPLASHAQEMHAEPDVDDIKPKVDAKPKKFPKK